LTTPHTFVLLLLLFVVLTESQSKNLGESITASKILPEKKPHATASSKKNAILGESYSPQGTFLSIIEPISYFEYLVEADKDLIYFETIMKLKQTKILSTLRF
jgi:hypothetical protein